MGVREPPHQAAAKEAPVKVSDLKTIGIAYWIVVGVGAVLTLARFTEAFLILRAQNAGLSLALAPLVLVIMNIVYSLSAYPLGRAFRLDRPQKDAGCRFCHADRRRHRPRDRAQSRHRHDRCRAVGTAHGDDAGPALGPRRRRSARQPARIRVRGIQFRQRRCPVAGEPDRRFPVGNFGPSATFIAGAAFTAAGLAATMLVRAKGSAARRRTSVTLVTTFRISRSIAAPASANFGKLWALANLLILVPLSYLKFLN